MNKRKIQLERRHFLQLVGASALSYPFLRGVPSYAAASGSAPTYLILVFTPCGCVLPSRHARIAPTVHQIPIA